MGDTENQRIKKERRPPQAGNTPWCGWKQGSGRDLRKDGSMAGRMLLLQNGASDSLGEVERE